MKTKLNFFLFAMICFASSAAYSVEDANRTWIQDFYDVLNKGQVDRLDEFVSEDYIDHALPPHIEPNREGLKSFFQMMITAFPDLHYEINFMVTEGDKIAVYPTISGTHKGEYLGSPGTGKQFVVKAIDLIQIVDGKMVEHWKVVDQVTMMQQLDISLPSTPKLPTEDLRAWVRKFYDVLNKGEVDRFDDFVSEDYVDHALPPYIDPNREGLKSFFKMMINAFPDLHYDINFMVTERDKVVVYPTKTGTHQGEYMGIAGTGKKFSIRGIDIIKVVQGKMVEHWETLDNLSMLSQLGIDMPPAPEANDEDPSVDIEDANKTWVRKFYETLNKGGVDRFDEFVSEDYVDHTLPPNFEPNREGLKEVSEIMFSAFPDLKYDINFMISEGDKVVVYTTMTGTHEGEYMGKPGIGQSFSIKSIVIIRVVDGKMVEHWELMDQITMLAQIEFNATSDEPPNECLAVYSGEGLHIPCVSVENMIFDVKMQQQPEHLTFDVDMDSIHIK